MMPFSDADELLPPRPKPRDQEGTIIPPEKTWFQAGKAWLYGDGADDTPKAPETENPPVEPWKTNVRTLSTVHTDIVNYLVNAVDGCPSDQVASYWMGLITPQQMLDTIDSERRFTGTREKVIDPIKNNFDWDQKIYAKSRWLARWIAIGIPVGTGGAVAMWFTAFNTWLNPVAWPHKIIDSGLSSVSRGWWASVPLHNLWSAMIVLTIALWVL